MIFSSKLLSSFLMSTIYFLLKYLRYIRKKTSSDNGENILIHLWGPLCHSCEEQNGKRYKICENPKMTLWMYGQ